MGKKQGGEKMQRQTASVKLWRVAFIALLAAALLAVLSPSAEAQSGRPDRPNAEFIFQNGRQHISMSWTDRGATPDAFGSLVQISTDLGTTWKTRIDWNHGASAARWNINWIDGEFVTKDTVYDIRVAWKLSNGRQSGWSQPFRLDDRPNNPGGNIYEISRTANSVTIGWTYPAGYTLGANLFQTPSMDGTYKGWAKHPRNQHTYNNLQAGDTYTFKVDAFNTDRQKRQVGEITVTMGGGNDNSRVLYSFPDDNPTRGWWKYAVNGGTLNFNTIGSGEGRALRMYQNTIRGVAGVGTNFTASNWSQNRGLSMRFKGNNSGEQIKFEVRDNGDERFLFTFTDSSSLWRTIDMPFSQFDRANWQIDGVPNDGFTKTGVTSIRIMPKGGSTEYHIDNIALTN